MNYKVMTKTPSGDWWWVGTVVETSKGHKFVSRTTNIGNSRKYWADEFQAVPKRLKDWRLEPTVLMTR